MGFWTIFAVIASIFAGGASYVQAKKAQKAAKRATDTQKGFLVNKESNVEPIPVIYGQRRVGGTRVFVSSDGREVVPGDPDYTSAFDQYYSDYDYDTDVYAGLTTTPTNKYLYVAIVLCEGRVQNISDIHLDDIPITDPKWQGKVLTQTYLGTDDQVAAPLLRESNERWTTNHRLRGVAYIACRFEYDPDVFNGIPEVTAVVTGRRVYDPRDGAQSSSNAATWTYSNNPALCLLDYLTNARFGKGLPYTAIDSAAFIEAANDCDASVTQYTGGGTGKLFECNIVLDTNETIFDNVNRFLIAMRGFLPYSQGVYQLRIDKSRSTVMNFNTTNIIGGINIKGESKQDKFNRVTVKFANPDNNWQDDTAIWPPAGSSEESQYLSEDGGVFLYDEIELDGITNYYQARDLARIFLLRSRNALRCGFKCTSDALQLAVGDVVTVTHATPGFVTKPFQVDEIAINTDGTCTLSLLEYDSTIYTWEVGTVQQTYPDTYLPNPYIVGVVANISVAETITINTDGSVVVDADVTWDTPTDSNIVEFDIEVKLTSEADSTYRAFKAPNNSYLFSNVPGGLQYTIRIRGVNALGIRGEWVTETYLLDGKTDSPNTPTSLAAVAGIKSAKLTWTNPVAKDIGLIRVYRNTSNSSGSATQVGAVYGTAFTDNGLADSTLYYYWVKAEDTSGNLSAFSSGTSVTTLVGASGDSVDIIFKRSATQPATPSPSSGTPAGWYSDVASVPAGSDPIWSSVGQKAGGAANYTWDTPVLVEGQDGTDGLSVAEVSIFIRSSSAPSTPTGGSFNFTTQTLTPPSSWSASVPAGTDPVYISRAVASISGTTGTDSTLTWSSPIVSFQNGATGATGAAGATGATGPRNALVYFFYNLTSSSAPSAPTTSDISYDFSTSTPSISKANWSASFDPAALSNADGANNKFWAVRVTFQETTYGGSYSETIVGPFVWTNFDGLVTFTNLSQGKDVDGNVSTTLIDGGAITADTLTVNSIKSNTSKSFGSTFMYELGTTTKVADLQGAGIFRTASADSFAIGGLANANNSFAVAGQQATNSTTAYGAAFVNSTTLGGLTHRTVSLFSNSATAAFFQDAARTVDICNGTYAIQTSGNVYVTGNITATGTITPFTGSHEGLVADDLFPEMGDILIDVEIVAKTGISNTLALMDLSSLNQSAIGVFSGYSTQIPSCITMTIEGEELAPGVIDVEVVVNPVFSSVMTGRKAIYVNSLGEGQINVCGEAGDIQAGDLIVTSSISGKGMKQSDDIIRAKTVAKARESVSFATATEVKQIACIYLCG